MVSQSSSTHGMKRGTSHAVATRKREFTNLREAEKIRHNRLATPVLICAVAMQPVTTATRFQVDQGQHQIIASEEPGECACRVCAPFGIAIDAGSRKAGRDRRRGFQRLL